MTNHSKKNKQSQKEVISVPDTGDIVWIDFSPHKGHEQSGRRPAVVLSPAKYNGKTCLMLCCPLTTKIKGYAFEVKISASSTGASESVALADQIKSVDWLSRNAKITAKVNNEELVEIKAKIKTLLNPI